MRLYEQIDELCKTNGTNITSMCKSAGVSRSALSDFKAGRVKTISRSNLQKIANYFKIDIACLTEENTPYCKECGLYYVSDIPSEVEFHSQRHAAWKRAVSKYGFCWPYIVREDVKEESYEVLNSEASKFSDKIEAARNQLKCYFSRSLEAAQYSLEHVDFPEFVAMLLNQKQFQERFGDSIWNELCHQYGKKQGIDAGTYYYIEGINKSDNKTRQNKNEKGSTVQNNTNTVKTIAAHLEGKELGMNQIKDVLSFIDFIKQKKL